MSMPHLNATLPPPGLPAKTSAHLVNELAALVEDMRRTRDWFNDQMDAQLTCLQQLRLSMQAAAQAANGSIATLLDAPRPVIQPPEPPPVPRTEPAGKTVILAPTSATLDPTLEQATLHELNNALAQAFSEISSRGGMLT